MTSPRYPASELPPKIAISFRLDRCNQRESSWSYLAICEMERTPTCLLTIDQFTSIKTLDRINQCAVCNAKHSVERTTLHTKAEVCSCLDHVWRHWPGITLNLVYVNTCKMIIVCILPTSIKQPLIIEVGECRKSSLNWWHCFWLYDCILSINLKVR